MSGPITDWLIRNYRIGYIFVLLCWLGWFLQNVLGTPPYDYFDLVVTMDHLAFYTAGRIALDPTLPAGSMYDLGFVAEYQSKLFPGKWEALEAFRNPPFYALLYTPTAWLPYQWSALIWSVISLLALVVGVRWLAPDRPRQVLWHAVGFYPVLAVMQYGQNSLLSFAVFSGTYRLLANRRPFAAGLAAGLLAFKPTLLIGLVVWALLDIRRLWPCILGAATTVVILCVGSYAIIPNAWEQFLATLPDNLKFDRFEWWKNHTPRAFVRLLIPSTVRTPWEGRATLAAALVGVAWFVLLWWKHKRDLRAMFGAVVLLTLWASPHALIYEWAIAFVAGYLWWERAPNRREWVIPLSVLWVALLISTDFCRLQVWVWSKLAPERSQEVWEPHPDGQVVILLQVSTPVLVWFGWAAWRRLRREVPLLGAEQP
jgi:alpha-1,2-mannosyltransferase